MPGEIVQRTRLLRIQDGRRQIPAMQHGVRLRALSNEHGRDAPAPRRQRPETHERVSAVVPGADERNDSSLGEQPVDDERGLTAGILHERRLGNPELVHGDPVVASGLRRGGRMHDRFPEPPAEAVRVHGYL